MKYKITRQYLDNFECEKRESKKVSYMDTSDNLFINNGFIIKYTYYYKNNSTKITLVSINHDMTKVKQDNVLSKINELFSINNSINIPTELNYKTLSSYIYYNLGKNFGVSLFVMSVLKLKNKNDDKICFIEFRNNSKEFNLYVSSSKGTEEIPPLLLFLLDNKESKDYSNLSIYNPSNNIFSGSEKLEFPRYFTKI